MEAELSRLVLAVAGLDEEVTRLFQYIEEEVGPETERRTASFLRAVSAKLTQAAAKLEARRK
jgi:hypothetical protein